MVATLFNDYFYAKSNPFQTGMLARIGRDFSERGLIASVSGRNTVV